MSNVVIAEINNIKDNLVGLMDKTGIDYSFSEDGFKAGWRLTISGAPGWLDCSLSSDGSLIYLDQMENGEVSESDHAYYCGINATAGMGSLGYFYYRCQNLTVIAAGWILDKVEVARQDNISNTVD